MAKNDTSWERQKGPKVKGSRLKDKKGARHTVHGAWQAGVGRWMAGVQYGSGGLN